MTKEENPQTQERDFPLSWKAQTPRFPHSHRTATAAVLASTPNQSHNHGLRYLLLYRLTHRFLGGSFFLIHVEFDHIRAYTQEQTRAYTTPTCLQLIEHRTVAAMLG